MKLADDPIGGKEIIEMYVSTAYGHVAPPKEIFRDA